MTKPRSMSYFKRASKAWEDGDIASAFVGFEKGAKDGDPSCHNNLGVFYEAGLGCQQSLPQAIKHYRRAYASGHTHAAFNIATAYVKIENRRCAIVWFKRAVDDGDGDAALEFAKFILSEKRRGYKNKALSLLNHITGENSSHDTRVEAESLIRKLV